MFGFEFEPQVSFNHQLLAKKEIFFHLKPINSKENIFVLENNIIDGEQNKKAILLPYNDFFPYIDTTLAYLEVRNTHPISTIELALKQINEITEYLAIKLYNYMEIPFAFILPKEAAYKYNDKYYGKHTRRILTKHLNFGVKSKLGQEIAKIIKASSEVYIKRDGRAQIIDIKSLGYKDERFHLRLPYRFKDYSLDGIIEYLNIFRSQDNTYKIIEKRYGNNKHEIVGYINSWGNWTWVNKYY